MAFCDGASSGWAALRQTETRRSKREVPAPRANARQEQNSPVSGHVSQGRVGGRQGEQGGRLPCSALCSELAINVTRYLRPHSPRKSTQELLLSGSADFMEGLGVLLCCHHPEILNLEGACVFILHGAL